MTNDESTHQPARIRMQACEHCGGDLVRDAEDGFTCLQCSRAAKTEEEPIQLDAWQKHLKDFRAKGGFERLGNQWLSEQKAEFTRLGVPFVF